MGNRADRLCVQQEMIKEQGNLRAGPKIYHDSVFEEEIKNLINITKEHYEAWVSPSQLVRGSDH